MGLFSFFLFFFFVWEATTCHDCKQQHLDSFPWWFPHWFKGLCFCHFSLWQPPVRFFCTLHSSSWISVLFFFVTKHGTEASCFNQTERTIVGSLQLRRTSDHPCTRLVSYKRVYRSGWSTVICGLQRTHFFCSREIRHTHCPTVALFFFFGNWVGNLKAPRCQLLHAAESSLQVTPIVSVVNSKKKKHTLTCNINI